MQRDADKGIFRLRKVVGIHGNLLNHLPRIWVSYLRWWSQAKRYTLVPRRVSIELNWTTDFVSVSTCLIG